MRRIIPTAAGVENVLKLSGDKWHGNWQRRAMQHIMKHRKSIIQFGRQCGKDFVLTKCCTAGILGALILTFTMPTLTQSQRIMFRSVSGNARKMENLFGSHLKRTRDTEAELLWSNGAQMRALSSNEASEKEGYTSHWVIVNEAHRAPSSIMSIVQPFTNQAQMEGTDKIILCGVGGHPASAIEAMKTKGFAALRITPEEIIADNPRYKQVVDEARETLSADEYRQYYDCLPITAGVRYLFPILQPTIELPLYLAGSTYYFGIDVGRTSDCTCVSVLEGCAGHCNLVEEFRMSGIAFPEQASRIYRFIDDNFSYVPENICLETNGLGMGLYDSLVKMMPGIQPVGLSYPLKRDAIFEIQKLVRDRKIGISDERARKELENVTFEMKESFKYVWDHSDSLSGLIMAYCATQKAVRV